MPGCAGVGDDRPAGQRPGLEGLRERDRAHNGLIVHVHREEAPVAGFSPPAPVEQTAHRGVVVGAVDVVRTVVHIRAAQGHPFAELRTDVEGDGDDAGVGGVGGRHAGVADFDGGFVHAGGHVGRHVHGSDEGCHAARRHVNRGDIGAQPGGIHFLVEVDAVLENDILAVGAVIQVAHTDEQTIQHAVERVVHPHFVAVAGRPVVGEAPKLPAVEFCPRVIPGQFHGTIGLHAQGAGVVDEVDDAVPILVFPYVAVAVDVLPVVHCQVEAVVPTVIAIRVKGIVGEHLAHDHQVGAGGDGNLVLCTKALQRDEEVEGLEEVVAVFSTIGAFRCHHIGRDGDAEGLRIDQLHPVIAHASRDGVRTGVVDGKGVGVGIARVGDVGEAGILRAAVCTGLPVRAIHEHAVFTAGNQRAHVAIDRTGTLGKGVVVQVGGRGHQQVFGGQEVRPGVVGVLVGLVNQRQDAAGDRGRAAGTAPRIPGQVTVQGSPGADTEVVQFLCASREGTASHHVRTARAARSGAAVGERGDVVVHDLHGAGDAVPAGGTVLGGCPHANGSAGAGGRYRTVG